MDKPLVLLVDDIPANLQVLGHLLRPVDCRIAVATSGEQALANAVENRPDLILLDVMMPGLDGLEVCTRLKAEPATAGIPVIFLTARTAPDDILRGFNAGGVDYVSKPYNGDELVARVRTHLDLKATRERLEQAVRDLGDALEQVKTLAGLLPICSGCKKIRNDEGYWERVEHYIGRHTDARFSHGICPECTEKYYPEFADRVRKRKEGEGTKPPADPPKAEPRA